MRRNRDAPIFVYALVAGRGLPATVRVGGERFRLVGRGAVAAVVSERGTATAPTASSLRRYDRTMRALAMRFPAMLPARFGTAVTEDELLFILSSRRASLARALASVRGRVQMTIRIVGASSASSASGASSASSTSSAPGAGRAVADTDASGLDYLKGKARAAAAFRVVPEFEPIRRALARWIRDERVDRRLGVTNIYHLIPRASAAAYQRTVQSAASDAGVRLVVSGPWPPYAFGAD